MICDNIELISHQQPWKPKAVGGQIIRKKKKKTVNHAKLSFKMRENKTFPDKQKLEEFVAKQTCPMRNTKGSPTD